MLLFFRLLVVMSRKCYIIVAFNRFRSNIISCLLDIKLNFVEIV